MAAQVLSGFGNVSYTNSTGQNVRLVINYLELGEGAQAGADMSWTNGASIFLKKYTIIGKTIPFSRTEISELGYPTEFALANGDTFSVIHRQLNTNRGIVGYNFIIIPEAG